MTAAPDSMDMNALFEQVDADLQILVLVSGELADGSAHYAYASIPPSKYAAFKEAEVRGNYDLGDFGTILRHGPGLNPPPDVERAMEEEYGTSHHFEEELLALGRQIEAELGKQTNPTG